MSTNYIINNPQDLARELTQPNSLLRKKIDSAKTFAALEEIIRKEIIILQLVQAIKTDQAERALLLKEFTTKNEAKNPEPITTQTIYNDAAPPVAPTVKYSHSSTIEELTNALATQQVHMAFLSKQQKTLLDNYTAARSSSIDQMVLAAKDTPIIGEDGLAVDIAKALRKRSIEKTFKYTVEAVSEILDDVENEIEINGIADTVFYRDVLQDEFAILFSTLNMDNPSSLNLINRIEYNLESLENVVKPALEHQGCRKHINNLVKNTKKIKTIENNIVDINDLLENKKENKHTPRLSR